MSRLRQAAGRVRGVAAGAGRAADLGDRFFVSMAGQAFRGLTGALAGVGVKGLGVIPFAAARTSRAILRFGEESAPLVEGSESVVMQSVPAAAHRTARVIEWIGVRAHGAGSAALAAAVGTGPRHAAEEENTLREIGRDVAVHVERGLDAFSVGLSVRARLQQLRRADTAAPRGTK